MARQLDVFQQVYAQCFTSEAACLLKGTENDLQNGLLASIKKVMGKNLAQYGWSLSWGPRVWKKFPNVATTPPDNAWFASFAPNVKYPDGTVIDTVVVAIAGTAEASAYAWLVEDFGVGEVVDFTAWNTTWKDGVVPYPKATPVAKPPGGLPIGVPPSYAALGTCIGVYQVLQRPSPAGFPQGGTTIMQYLQTLKPKTRVIFTGHSLGGALSPTVAMGTLLAAPLRQISDPLHNVLVLPCAGTTPGDSNFSDGYKNLLQRPAGSGYQVWNANLCNSLDIVSMAWCTRPEAAPKQNMDLIPNIYGAPSFKLEVELTAMAAVGIYQADKSGIVYIPIESNAFTGPKPHVPLTMVDFFTQALYQHTRAYHDYIKIADIVTTSYSTLASSEGITKQNLEQAIRQYPVLQSIRKKHIPLGEVETYPYDDILLAGFDKGELDAEAEVKQPEEAKPQ